jgi:hypothetical protein
LEWPPLALEQNESPNVPVLFGCYEQVYPVFFGDFEFRDDVRELEVACGVQNGFTIGLGLTEPYKASPRFERGPKKLRE